MSSTGRGGERSEADYYPTPAWAVHRLLERYPLPGGHWIEPGAGQGHIIRGVNSFRSDVFWTAIEMRESCRVHLSSRSDQIRICNFLNATVEGLDLVEPTPTVAFGNPPFRHAIEFIHRARMFAPWVVMLLRTNFMESDERADFIERFPPDICRLPDRISFTGNGESDSTGYSWFVWPPGDRAEGRFIPLAKTGLHERRSQFMKPETYSEQLQLLA